MYLTRILAILTICFCCINPISAQLHDAQWIQGWWSNQGRVMTDFSTGEIEQTVLYDAGPQEMQFTNPIMCDSLGQLLFYTNGTRVYNKEHNMMPNGDTMSISPYLLFPLWPDASTGGTGLLGACILLPSDNDSIYEMIHLAADNKRIKVNGQLGNYNVCNLQYSRINMNLDNGLGDVVFKNEIILDDTLTIYGMTATKQANGRDWWIAVQEAWTDGVFIINFSSVNGISIEKQKTSYVLPQSDIGGGAEFSPNGRYYARLIDYYPWDHLIAVEICDFNRETGKLSNCNYRTFSYSKDQFDPMGEMEFSPNSRFLYVPNKHYLFQFDMENDDPLSVIDTIAEWEERYYFDFWHPLLNFATLVPGDRILLSSSGNAPWLGMIHYPNRKGKACQVEQYAITTPIFEANNVDRRSIPIWGMPDPPYYRLGPLDGSSADTLGYDNHPVAWFREELGPSGNVYFADLSYYEPVDWQWWFGDSKMSNDQNPSHQYEASGVYEVCLEVSNEYSSHEFCKEVEIIITNNEEKLNNITYHVSPSIITDRVIVLTPNSAKDAKFLLYDVLGRPVLSKYLRPEGNYVNTASLKGGVYFYSIMKGNENLYSGKLIKY